MSTDAEKLSAQKAAFDHKPTQPWHRHLVGPAELETLLQPAANDPAGALPEENSQWQSINTAPIDGTHVYVLYPQRSGRVEAWYDTRLVGWYSVDGFYNECRRISPTHWLPLINVPFDQPDPQGVEVTEADRNAGRKLAAWFEDGTASVAGMRHAINAMATHRAAAVAENEAKWQKWRADYELKVAQECEDHSKQAVVELLRGWPVECLLLLKSLMLVWGDKFAPGTKEQFGAIEKAALSQTAVTTDRVAEATKPLVDALREISNCDDGAWAAGTKNYVEAKARSAAAMRSVALDALRAHEERVKGGKQQ